MTTHNHLSTGPHPTPQPRRRVGVVSASIALAGTLLATHVGAKAQMTASLVAQSPAMSGLQQGDFVASACDTVPANELTDDGPGPAYAELVGEGEESALAFHEDGTFVYFRMRLAESPVADPSQCPDTPEQVLQPFGWALQLDVDGDPDAYEVAVVITRQGLSLWANTAVDDGRTAGDAEDQPEALVFDFPEAQLCTHLAVTPAGTHFGSGDPMGDEDVFLTVAVAIADLLTTANVAVEPDLSVPASLSVRAWASTSPHGITFDGDRTCRNDAGASPDPFTLPDSSASPLVIDYAAPALSIAAPLQDEIVRAESVTLVGAATDLSLTSVSVTIVDHMGVSVVTDEPAGITGDDWALDIASLIDGSVYTATVTAADAWGRQATQAVTFLVSTSVAPLTVTSPSGPVGDATPRLVGTGEPGALVTATVDATTYGPVTVDWDGLYRIDVTGPLPHGTHTFELTQTLGAQVSTLSVDVKVDLTVSLDITIPRHNALLGTQRPTFAGTTDAGATVRIWIDGVASSTVLSGPDGTWEFVPVSKLPVGKHTLRVRTEDTAGNRLESDIDFSVQDLEADADGDGLTDLAEDRDGDGDLDDDDTDGDGKPDYLDPDDDNDGIPTRAGVHDDSDHDGVPDYLDPDDDNDGIPTRSEGRERDTDGDGTLDYLDPDDDGDGIPTATEGAERDTDRDRVPDYLDDDDDGDGIPTRREGTTDSDGDNLSDYLDPDDDGDGVPTGTEGSVNDIDGDGIPDYLDTDDDGDGIPTAEEGPTADSDGDGVPDYLEPHVDAAPPPAPATRRAKPKRAGSVAGRSLFNCSSSPGTAGGSELALFLLALLWVRRRSGKSQPARGAVVVALLLLSTVTGARAQVRLEQYRPAPLATDGFALSRPTTPGHNVWGSQVQLDYGREPLVVEADAGDPDSVAGRAVTHHTVMHGTVSLGLLDAGLVYVGYYANLAMSGDSLTGIAPADGASPGDLAVGGRYRLFGHDGSPWALAAEVIGTIPLAAAMGDYNYAGEKIGSLEPRALGSFRVGPVELIGNLGARFRKKQQEPGVAVGSELTYGVGGQALVERVRVHGELWGTSAFSGFGDRAASPMELLVGGKWLPCNAPVAGWSFGLAASTGMQPGYGTPLYRLVAAVGYGAPEGCGAPAPEPAVVAEPPLRIPADADADGRFDDEDRCPTEPEDADGFQDEDGCPDPDNDGDGVPDGQDLCPRHGEDADGFEDADGCPDPAR